MTIEIKTPELEALIAEKLGSGHFQNLDELLLKALSALPVGCEPHGTQHRKPNFAQFLLDSPLPGSGLELERHQDYPRPIDL